MVQEQTPFPLSDTQRQREQEKCEGRAVNPHKSGRILSLGIRPRRGREMRMLQDVFKFLASR